jgi:hypothetical protein
VAALNERYSKGVTPENNAALPLLKAMGPGEIKPEHRAEYCRMLGIRPLPEKGDYYVTIDKYAAGLKPAEKPAVKPGEDERFASMDQQTEAQKRPWSKKEFPVVAGWLAANEKPLALVIAASKLPRRYDPLVSGDQIAVADLLSAMQQHREASRALTARAMLRVDEGKLDQAWEDLLACHRLARLVGQGPTSIDELVAITMNSVTCAADQVFLQHAQPTPAQIARMRADLDKLSPMPKMVDNLDVGERFLFLDCVGMVARKGPGALDELACGREGKGKFESLIDSTAWRVADWDQVLRMGNSWYDRLVEACGKPTRAERRSAIGKIDAELGKLAAASKDWRSLGGLIGISERTGNAIVSIFLPATWAISDCEDRGAMQFDLTRLAFALAAYHADRGSYPAKLAELSPKYVAEIPKDIFNGDSDLIYRREGGGYVLYSVGSNGKDDGGRGREEDKEGEGWDDIVVRVPAGK